MWGRGDIKWNSPILTLTWTVMTPVSFVEHGCTQLSQVVSAVLQTPLFNYMYFSIFFL
jgi:hypothetical protein